MPILSVTGPLSFDVAAQQLSHDIMQVHQIYQGTA